MIARPSIREAVETIVGDPKTEWVARAQEIDLDDRVSSCAVATMGSCNELVDAICMERGEHLRHLFVVALAGLARIRTGKEVTSGAQSPTLTKNDRRTLAAVRDACDEWDAFMPHEPAYWTGVRRLMVVGLVQEFETLVVCDSCSPKRHEGRGFTLTEAGKLEVGP